MQPWPTDRGHGVRPVRCPAEVAASQHAAPLADPSLIQKVYDELISLGYQPVAPSPRKPGRTPEQYLRWIANGEGPTRAYLNTASLGFSRRDDIAKVARLPGAEGRAGFVKFSILTPKEAEQALAAARAVL
jgi:hypothetical protein